VTAFRRKDGVRYILVETLDEDEAQRRLVAVDRHVPFRRSHHGNFVIPWVFSIGP